MSSHVMIRTRTSASRRLLVTVVVCLLAGAFGAWWVAQPPGTGGAAEPDELTASSSHVTAEQLDEVKRLQGQQAAATSVVARQPELKPVDRSMSERPEYVSPIEWAMLRGVAQQDADPPKMLARLVNSLRFTKQMELWEGLSTSPDQVEQRHRLAAQLLEDLPNRVAQGDLALEDARDKLDALIADAVEATAGRAQRWQKEWGRLQAAHANYQARSALAEKPTTATP